MSEMDLDGQNNFSSMRKGKLHIKHFTISIYIFTSFYVNQWNAKLTWTILSYSRCPLDDEIMSAFEYSSSKTTALVHFQAHKFPYAPSVYYQCNVRLCIRHAGGCDDVVSILYQMVIQGWLNTCSCVYYRKLKENIVFQPPICENGENLVKRRRKRQTRVIDETQGDLYDTDREDLKVKVYSGLYVNEASDLDDAFLDSDVPTEIVSIPQHIVVNKCFWEEYDCIK